MHDSSIMRSFVLLISIVCLVIVLVPMNQVLSLTLTDTGGVYITAQVNTDTSSGGGGGGSSGGGSGISVPTTVNFSGKGYPSSKIVILKDGEIAISTIADPSANFSAAISNLASGTYTFGIYTEDKEGRHSIIFSFPVYVTSGTTVNISGIILSPTIDVDKSQVKRGENLAIFGYAVPDSEITITVNSDNEQIVKANTDKTGVYLYNFDTSPLEYGSHTAKSRAILQDQVSATTDPVGFSVATETKDKDTEVGACGLNSVRGDLNCDTRVNLVDFSIMAYWYNRKTTPPVIVDLNSDTKITLVDFSILAFNWTG